MICKSSKIKTIRQNTSRMLTSGHLKSKHLSVCSYIQAFIINNRYNWKLEAQLKFQKNIYIGIICHYLYSWENFKLFSTELPHIFFQIYLGGNNFPLLGTPQIFYYYYYFFFTFYSNKKIILFLGKRRKGSNDCIRCCSLHNILRVMLWGSEDKG